MKLYLTGWFALIIIYLDGSEDGQQVGDGEDDDDGQEEASGHHLKR